MLTYSGTYVNQQWPCNPETPGGAWEFHRTLIPNSPAKPIRIWMEVGDRDLLNPNVMRDDMHDWVLANENMAQGARREGLPLPVRLRPQRAATSDRAVEAADAARTRSSGCGRATPSVPAGPAGRDGDAHRALSRIAIIEAPAAPCRGYPYGVSALSTTDRSRDWPTC